MGANTYTLSLDGETLRRGFWLYVWDVATRQEQQLLYVGRTGDSSSPNAQSPFNRMGQHLGNAKNSSMLRNHLTTRKVRPEQCRFRLVAYGPILPEPRIKNMIEHKKRRDIVAALEKKLADDLRSGGYDVLNWVSCNRRLNATLYKKVKTAFEVEFPGLSSV